MSMTATATAQPAGQARLRTREPLIQVPAATELTRVSYTTNLLKETPDKYEAQEKLESWAKDLFANAEIAKQDRRERLRKTSPHAVEYVSQDPEFQKFIWTWANLIEERLNVFQLTGLQPDCASLWPLRFWLHRSDVQLTEVPLPFRPFSWPQRNASSTGATETTKFSPTRTSVG
jgi:hypothetical protein